MSDPFTPSNAHPDLRELIALQLNELAEQRGETWPPEMRFEGPLNADDMEITCQRTWRDVSCLNPNLDGGAFSACVARFESGGKLHAYFAQAVQRAGSELWGVAGMSGGPQPAEDPERAGGFMLAGGSHVTIGGTGFVPNGGSLTVELADGRIYGDHAREGCAIVFAPVMTEPSPTDEVVIRLLDADGVELDASTHWLGDGKPPGVEPAPSE